MTLWHITAFLVSISRQPEQALFWYGAMSAVVLGQFAIYFVLVRELLNLRGRPQALGFSVLLWLVSWVFLLFFQDQVFSGVVWSDRAGFFLPEFGPWAVVIGIPNYLLLIVTVTTFVRGYRRVSRGAERLRLQYVLAGMVVVIAGTVANFVPYLNGYPLDLVSNIVNATLIGYAIFRHQLLDMRVVIRRGLLYSVTSFIVGAAYFSTILVATTLFHQLTGPALVTLSLVVAVLVALIAEPLRERVQSWIDKLFFREKYDSNRMLQRLSRTAASVLDLQQLTNLILDEVTDTIHIHHAAILLKTTQSGRFEMTAWRGIELSVDFSLAADHPIAQWMSTNNKLLAQSDFDTLPQFRALWDSEKNDLGLLGAELFFPLHAKGELVGILAVGPKLSEESYTSDDRLTLATLADQIAVAVSNALLYDETDRLRAFNENIIQSMDEGIVLQDEDGVITFANAKVLDLLGYDAQEIVGRPFSSLVAPESVAAVEDTMQQLAGGRTVRYETVLLTADGRRIVALGGARAVVNVDSDVAGSLSVFTDITERKKVEEERMRLLERVREQMQLIHQIMDTVPEGVVLLGEKNHIILANSAANAYLEVLAGVGVGEMLSHLGNVPLPELLAAPATEGLWHAVELFEAKEAGAFESAPIRIFEVIARPMQTGVGQSGGWVLVLRDVTQERQVQQQIQQQDRLAALGQLAAGIAHDFNNIMATIILLSEVMERDPVQTARNRERLSTIRKQGRRAADLTQQILDFSRRSIIHLEELDLLPFLQEMRGLLRRMVPESIRINLVGNTQSPLVKADPTRLQQAVMNLAINARDAMPEGGELTFEVDEFVLTAGESPSLVPTLGHHVKSISPGHWVRLQVRDTGTGIPAVVLPHIFEPFYTTKEVGKGTGLGLSQVFGIVRQHGGVIEVDSQQGVGTVFSVYLPAVVVENGRNLDAGAPLTRGEQELILLVEDDPATCISIRESLNLLNYEVMSAGNGSEAIRLYEEHRSNVALVLTDLVMPEMGGLQLVVALKDLNPQLPVLVMSGYPQSSQENEMQATNHVNGWLYKPVTLEQLATAVAAALR